MKRKLLLLQGQMVEVQAVVRGLEARQHLYDNRPQAEKDKFFQQLTKARGVLAQVQATLQSCGEVMPDLLSLDGAGPAGGSDGRSSDPGTQGRAQQGGPVLQQPLPEVEVNMLQQPSTAMQGHGASTAAAGSQAAGANSTAVDAESLDAVAADAEAEEEAARGAASAAAAARHFEALRLKRAAAAERENARALEAAEQAPHGQEGLTSVDEDDDSSNPPDALTQWRQQHAQRMLAELKDLSHELAAGVITRWQFDTLSAQLREQWEADVLNPPLALLTAASSPSGAPSTPGTPSSTSSAATATTAATSSASGSQQQHSAGAHAPEGHHPHALTSGYAATDVSEAHGSREDERPAYSPFADWDDANAEDYLAQGLIRRYESPPAPDPYLSGSSDGNGWEQYPADGEGAGEGDTFISTPDGGYWAQSASDSGSSSTGLRGGGSLLEPPVSPLGFPVPPEILAIRAGFIFQLSVLKAAVQAAGLLDMVPPGSLDGGWEPYPGAQGSDPAQTSGAEPGRDDGWVEAAGQAEQQGVAAEGDTPTQPEPNSIPALWQQLVLPSPNQVYDTQATPTSVSSHSNHTSAYSFSALDRIKPRKGSPERSRGPALAPHQLQQAWSRPEPEDAQAAALEVLALSQRPPSPSGRRSKSHGAGMPGQVPVEGEVPWEARREVMAAERRTRLVQALTQQRHSRGGSRGTGS
ncbi:hypothetical protein HaLaN_00982 [Haematococcus lacustris]|uniref:Uncharacterized protein n=1 Tax=Haematococcus lacustris TaxID=44745 RepID=A0A699YAI7_HAELA|nr:hypothetical protein HaLaN_00982 [Haematococcus lacustris]